MAKNQPRKKKTARQILAIIGIILLAGLYVMTFVLSLFDSPNCQRMFGVSIIATVIIPVMLYCYSLMSKWSEGRRSYNEAVLKMSADDDADSQTTTPRN